MQSREKKYSDYKYREKLLWRDSNICRPSTRLQDELASVLHVVEQFLLNEGKDWTKLKKKTENFVMKRGKREKKIWLYMKFDWQATKFAPQR